MGVLVAELRRFTAVGCVSSAPADRAAWGRREGVNEALRRTADRLYSGMDHTPPRAGFRRPSKSRWTVIPRSGTN